MFRIWIEEFSTGHFNFFLGFLFAEALVKVCFSIIFGVGVGVQSSIFFFFCIALCLVTEKMGDKKFVDLALVFVEMLSKKELTNLVELSLV